MELNVPEIIQVELIVVDNNSKDDTASIVAKAKNYSRIPIKYVLEKKQGLSYARVAGINHANGELIAFTDDDVIVDKEWLTGLWHAYKDWGAVCVGGPIEPLWGAPPPKWLTKELYGALALLDLGEEEIQLGRPRLWGANMAFIASVFEKYGGFEVNLGRTADKLYAGEETALIKRLIDEGEVVVYTPNAKVLHMIPMERLDKRYFRRWYFDQGELQAKNKDLAGGRSLAGIPLYRWRYALADIGKWFVRIIVGDKRRFSYELKVMEHCGYIKYAWNKKYNKSAKTYEENN